MDDPHTIEEVTAERYRLAIGDDGSGPYTVTAEGPLDTRRAISVTAFRNPSPRGSGRDATLPLERNVSFVQEVQAIASGRISR